MQQEAAAAPAGHAERAGAQQAARLELELRQSRCGHPTTWTIIQHDGPNHLGL